MPKYYVYSSEHNRNQNDITIAQSLLIIDIAIIVIDIGITSKNDEINKSNAISLA